MGKSNVVPMKILFKDEKYKSETTEILTRLVKDAELSGNQRYAGSLHTHRKIDNDIHNVLCQQLARRQDHAGLYVVHTYNAQ